MKEELIKLFEEYSALTEESRKADPPMGKEGEDMSWYEKVQFHDFMRWLAKGEIKNKV